MFHFELAAGDLAAGGKVTLVDGAVSVLDLRRLSLSESNLSVTARRREDGGYAVTIDGERLSLPGLVNRSEKTRLRPRRLNLWRAWTNWTWASPCRSAPRACEGRGRAKN